jgi:dTDP-4-dehydrorhamnose 3,5-epimerase
VRVIQTKINGLLILELDSAADHRGSLARTYSRESFVELGLDPHIEHGNAVWTAQEATLRGLHYQVPPAAERKVVHCVAGAIYDVVVDIRSGSSTYGDHVAIELRGGEPRSLWVPEGCAHGYQTLTDNTCVYYFMSSGYDPEHERGISWNDPAFGIEWPLPNPILSDRDRSHPPFEF